MASTEIVTPLNKTTSSNGPNDNDNELNKPSIKAKSNSATHSKLKEADFTQKLKCKIEKLHLDNADLKKALDGERSAARALRSQCEVMWRKERADFRKREEFLETQLKEMQRKRAAIPTIVPERHCCADSNRMNVQVETLRKTNRDLHEKIQIVAEAEKRAVAELRAREDARATELNSAARLARTQTAKLLEEIKTKDRQIDQLKNCCRTVSKATVRISPQYADSSTETDIEMMSEIDRLHSLEAEINRLENELQRRNCVINELKSAKTSEKYTVHTQEKPMANRHRKELFIRDTISDVDSALSSGPNSLSPQPSPDFWETQNSEMELEIAKKQIRELQKLLNESAMETGCALSRLARSDAEAARLRDSLRDARDHADLLEFRLLEIDDSAADKLGDTLQCIRDAISDADSGCVSPGNRLNGSASPEFSRGDSGYKSPIFRQSIDARILSTPTLNRHHSSEDLTDGFRIGAMQKNLKIDDLKHKLELMLLSAGNDDDKNCIEQLLSLLWDLQTLNTSMKDDYFAKTYTRKLTDKYDKLDNSREIESQARTNKIIATISPYSRKSLYKEDDIQIDLQPKIKSEPDALNEGCNTIKYSKLLQESGIFEDISYDSKESQTDFPETCGGETTGDLNTEIDRLNEIREQLEKSGAIINANLKNNEFNKDILAGGDNARFILSNNHKKFYDRRLKLLEEKVLFYESTKDRQDIKLAERLHRESVLESQIDDLISQLDKLKSKYESLEEECCELDEAENDTRLHCQQLEIDYELVTAQLHDMEEQRDSAKQQAADMELMVRDYEETNVRLLEQEHELRDRLEAIETTMPALIFWNVFKIVEANPKFDFKAALTAKFGECPPPIQRSPDTLPAIDCSGQKICRAMLAYQGMPDGGLAGDIDGLQSHLQKLVEEREMVHTQHEQTEQSLRGQITELERMLNDSTLAAQRLEEETNQRIGSLERELAFSLEKARDPLNQALKQIEEGQTFDNECMLRLQQLHQNENELKNRIRELEHREMAYLETLTQADDMWADMESGYKTQIKEKHDTEEQLKEEMKQCVCDKDKWKSQCDILKQRIRELEEEETQLQEHLKNAVGQTHRLSEQNGKFKEQLEDLNNEAALAVAKSASEMHTIHVELDSERCRCAMLTQQLDTTISRSKEVEEQLSDEIEEARKEIADTCKELVHLDLTNCELKEEVETLEKQVVEMNDMVNEQRESFEDQLKSLARELQRKSKEVEQLVMEQNTTAMSALQELGMANVHGQFGAVTSTTPEDREVRGRSCECDQFGFNEGTPIIGDSPAKKRFKSCTCPSVRNKLIEELTVDMFDKMFKKVEEKSMDPEYEDVNHETCLSVHEITLMESQLTEAVSKIMECAICSRTAPALIRSSIELLRIVLNSPNSQTTNKDSGSIRGSKILCWKPLPTTRGPPSQDKNS